MFIVHVGAEFGARNNESNRCIMLEKFNYNCGRTTGVREADISAKLHSLNYEIALLEFIGFVTFVFPRLALVLFLFEITIQ